MEDLMSSLQESLKDYQIFLIVLNLERLLKLETKMEQVDMILDMKTKKVMELL